MKWNTLLIIGAGMEQVKAYHAAREMGLFVAGTDIDPDAPAFEHADFRILASTRDPEGTVRAVKRFAESHPVHGVMTIANDVPLTVARVAEELGLPGIPVEAARLASDKLAMKERFLRKGVAIPEFTEIKRPADIKKAAREWGWPVVVKPVDGRGARGVLRVTKKTDPEWAFTEALAHSDRGAVMAEEYVEGMQVSTESVMWRGRCHTPAFSERNYEYLEKYSPYIIENGGTMPAPLNSAEQEAVNNLIERAALAMGIKEGTVKGDIVMGPDGPVIIELAARLSGGYYATDQIPLATGVDLVKVAVKLALGAAPDPAEFSPRFDRGAAIRFFFPPEGRVKGVAGAEEIESMPGVSLAKVYRKAGDVQPPITSHPDRGGFVLAGGVDREEAEARAEEAVRSVVFDVEPPNEGLKTA